MPCVERRVVSGSVWPISSAIVASEHPASASRVAYPMVDEGERLEITFNVYWISYKKSSLNYAPSDWSKVYLRYECAKREHVVDEVKLGGI